MKLICSLLLTLFVCLSISAKTVDLKDYTTPNDGLDDAPGLQTAVNDLRAAGGGKIYFSEGSWDLKSQTDFINGYASYVLEGDPGAVVKVTGIGPGTTAFHVGNINSFVMRDLTMVGSLTPVVDTGFLVVSNYTDQLLVTNCRFYGIYAKYGLFVTGNVDAVYENSSFSGSGSDVAIIRGGTGHTFRSITVRNSLFLDYQNFNGAYYSKPGETAAWIRVDGEPDVPVNAISGGAVTIDGVRLDEAALTAIDIRNVRNVNIRNASVNVNGTDRGIGMVFDRVKYGRLENVSLGFSAYARPAFIVRNKSNILVSSVELGGAVQMGGPDATSSLNFSSPCDKCAASLKPAQTREF